MTVTNHQLLKKDPTPCTSHVTSLTIRVQLWGTSSPPETRFSVGQQHFWPRSENWEKRLLTSSCLSICLSVCPYRTTRPPLHRLPLNLIFFFRKCVEKIQVSLKSDKNNGYFTRGPIYTECPGGNVPDFGKMFLTLKYTDLTQNTYFRSWTVTEIMAREKCGLLAVPSTVPVSRVVTRTLRMPVYELPLLPNNTAS